ncbi:ABC transporter ATP-binding protein [Micromonospora narathiwatensis]|uniref:ABC transporter n=1 Tax=Micromonospora narathiwatensis TaxID=299146 RepID=A0A1A9A5Z0_9ACTN|nr:ATP-binding cassette domain-containing protein [Micromonospora narathiwatensis]SBT51609.1 ABC transporter [Micromonospora narathiwatensis]
MRLENVWLRYHRRGPWVLRQTEVRIGPGEAAVVLGRNGAGKSTLLQLTAGGLRPTRGRVVDRPAAVGWVPERFPADQPFTVAQYLAAMGRVAGLSGPATDRAVRHWVDRLGLARFWEVRLPRLSKGTAQKVGLAQALLRRPGLLVLDEPWEGLDAAARELVPVFIDEVLADGGTVLVSDHRGETVRLPGARRWTVADGTVTEQASSGDTAMAVVELAVPAAGVAAAVARLRADGHHVLRVREHAAPPPATRPDPGPPPDATPRPVAAPPTDAASPPAVAPLADAASPPAARSAVPPADAVSSPANGPWPGIGSAQAAGPRPGGGPTVDAPIPVEPAPAPPDAGVLAGRDLTGPAREVTR